MPFSDDGQSPKAFLSISVLSGFFFVCVFLPSCTCLLAAIRIKRVKYGSGKTAVKHKVTLADSLLKLTFRISSFRLPDWKNIFVGSRC